VGFALESTGVPQLTAPQISKYSVALPPTKAEQAAIAEALSDADALIESLEQLIAKKCHVKQGAMQELLTGKKRLPGFSRAWQVKRLEELGVWRGGMTPSMRNSSYWQSGTMSWISSGDVKSVRLTSTAFSVSEYAVRQGATNAALALAHMLLRGLDAEILMHPWQLFYAAVEEHEIMHQLDQPVLAA
jgi:type I restriction enzyme, S subunit